MNEIYYSFPDKYLHKILISHTYSCILYSQIKSSFPSKQKEEKEKLNIIPKWKHMAIWFKIAFSPSLKVNINFVVIFSPFMYV